MSKTKKPEDKTDALLVQKHQQSSAQQKLEEISQNVSGLHKLNSENLQRLDELDAELNDLLSIEGLETNALDEKLEPEVEDLLQVDINSIKERHQISLLNTVGDEDLDWDQYMAAVRSYAQQNGVDLTGDPFSRLMTDSQRIEIERRIDEDLTYKKANCDLYDYMVAVTCGMIAGLVDVIFVGAPKEKELGKKADKTVDGAVIGIAKMLGWPGPREGSDAKASAIGFLERKYKVNYDQIHGKPLGIPLTPANHHLKNLAHSPDLVGLFFSLVNQFTSTSTFVNDGQLITIDTETFELKGGNFPAKIYAGFCNWFWHLASDVAGSSGSSTRGSGIPIPFFSMLQFLNFGKFGQDRDTFGQLSVKVFQEGYDFRHGLALAIPVLIAELLTRISWSFKQRLYHGKDWKDCIPESSNPELRHMLLVSHGTLCIVDGVDAGLRSGGGSDPETLMLHMNIIAWVKFGHSAIKELRVWYKAGKIDIEAANEYLDSEYEKLLKNQIG